MAEYQITLWRDIPSMIAARDDADGGDVTKVQLAPRLQEAIDEAAMRLGDTGSDQYLEGWTRSGWTTQDGTAAEVAAEVSRRLEEQWTDDHIATYLDTLGS